MQDILDKIHSVEGFTNASLHKISCSKESKAFTFYCITDQKYSDDGYKQVQELLQSILSNGFIAKLQVEKAIADSQLIKNSILEFAKEQTLLSIFLRPEDIQVEIVDKDIKCKLLCTESEYAYLQNNNKLLQELNDYLSSRFCNNVQIDCIVCETKQDVVPVIIQQEDEQEEQKIRTFTIENVERIDKEEPSKEAVYLEDCTFLSEHLTVCGVIIDIKQCVSKSEKEYLRLTIDDKSATKQITYFFKKATKEKILQLKVGDSVVCVGKNELFNNAINFTAQAIHYGRAAADFVLVQKKGKPVPKQYKVVHPEKIIDYNQMDLFTKEMLPKEFVEQTFVVFDIETTGLVNDPISGKMDAVTEIGAVKIVGAEICEKFSVLIDPKRKLERKIIEITGITDEMLVGQPTIDKVVGDFYKFCHGAILVAHNVNFDYKFMKYYCEQENYILDNKRMDTVTFAQEVLHLSNYKLNTIANHFHITFNHHRAFDDALTTAKIFIELIKLKKGLPSS